jgi:DNA relaxase NicK
MPPQLRYFETFGGGQTMYVGSVKSDRMGRIYDKGLELKTYPSGALWRYELQLRNEVANKIADTLSSSGGRGQEIGAAVATFFRQRKCPVAWGENVGDLPIVVHRPATSDDVRREWLRATVAPVMRNLAQRWSVKELISWIGLDGLDSRV